MISTKSKAASPDSKASSSFAVFSKPLATAMRTVASPTVSSREIHGVSGVASVVSHTLKSGFSPVMRKAAERRAASITPPVRPKMVAAPLDSPSGLSKGVSVRFAQFTPTIRSKRLNSRTVSTASTSASASVASSGTSHSYFFATQGMMDTTNRRLPASAASAARVFFTTAPII